MNKSFTVVDSSSGVPIESEVSVLHPAEAFEQKPSAPPVTRAHVIVDGDRDEEAVTLNPSAGASSEAPASSGIPSAMTQHQQWSEKTERKSDTLAADHVLPKTQDSL